MVLPLEEQRAILQRDLHLAWNRLAASVTIDHEIEALALARLEAGFGEFGDSGWHKTPFEIKRDIREEIADCLVYLVMLIRAEREIARQATRAH